MNNKPQVLYTVYRDSDDELMAFEEPADKCARLMGITKSYFWHIASYGCGYTVIKTSAKAKHVEI